MHTTDPAPELHLVIATGQNLANLIPSLQLGAREVWVLQTPRMKASAGHLADALRAREIEVRRMDFDDRDVATLHEQAEHVAEQLDGRPVTINLSGGTKLMTLALTQTLAAHLGTGAEQAVPHLIYTDTEHQRLDRLAPAPHSEPMQSVLKLPDVWLAQGYRELSDPERANRQRTAEERKGLTRWIGEHAATLARFFGTMNALAQAAAAEGQPFAGEQYLDFVPGGKAAVWLEQATQAGLLYWDGSERLVFPDPAAARYLGGGWAEELVWLKAQGCQCDGGWSPGLRLKHVGSGSENELDTVLLHRNRLLVVECKAGRAGERATDWIYKLAQLARQIGGSFAQSLLVSARPLGAEHLRRAQEYGVSVLAAQDLARLGEWLRDWQNRR